MKTCKNCRYILTTRALGCLKFADYGRPYEVEQIKKALENHNCKEFKPMGVICSGKDHPSCDKTCIHATPHEAHANGCMCEDCNVNQDPEGGVGCINDDTCVEIKEVVKCKSL